MLFTIKKEDDHIVQLEDEKHADLDILERDDLEEWVIREPRLLGEELLIISSEYVFEDTRDRLDILALDRKGKLIVAELKRDQADRTTDLQAIKYASYCSNLTAEDIQKDFRSFWNDRANSKELSPEEVGTRFSDFLSENLAEEIVTTEEGWAEFDLDDQPRIILAAGSFGTEVTSPVMWLIQEYGLEISCVQLRSYEHEGEIVLSSRQLVPPPEAEEYMTRRREKKEKQRIDKRRRSAYYVLLEKGILESGDVLIFNDEKLGDNTDREFDPNDNYWRVEITGKQGQSDNVRWLHNGEEYSFTGVSKELLHQLNGREKSKSLNGNKYWCHPEYDHRTISDIRNNGTER